MTRKGKRTLILPALWGIFAEVIALAPASQIEIPSSGRSREVIARIRPALTGHLAGKGLLLGSPIYLRIFKETALLEVWVRSGRCFRLFKIYPICRFSGNLGPKRQMGDLQAPEGFYYVTPDRMNPNSLFHLSFDLGYPNAFDRVHGCTGDAIQVHGSCASIGCFAMTDAGIEEIYALADAAFRAGQRFFRVHVFPFPMTEENMELCRDSEWHVFWSNLKEGYDFFARTCRPPNVLVQEGRYVFGPSY